MEIAISVHVDVDDTHCGIMCPWLDVFGMIEGKSEPCPKCTLCHTMLSEDPMGIMRCSDCLDFERRFHEEARIEALNNAVQNKPAAIRLLKELNYSLDISTFDSASALLRYLMEKCRLSVTYLIELLDMSAEDIQAIASGKPYPYLIQRVQQMLGVPRPVHIDADEEMRQAIKRLHQSDMD